METCMLETVSVMLFQDVSSHRAWHCIMRGLDCYVLHRLSVTMCIVKVTCALYWYMQTCTFAEKQVSTSNVFVKHYVPIYLTFDLKWWPWPWPFTNHNVQFHEIHMHAKYAVAIFNRAKVIAKCKSWRKQTGQQTNRQGKNNMSPTIVVGDIKNTNIYKTNAYWSTEDEQLVKYVIHFNVILNDSFTNKQTFISSYLLVDFSNCTY